MTKLLIVDDETRMQKLLQLLLEPKGYICKTVSNGIDALDTMKREAIDLILLDIMMPNMNGWETAKAIREFSDVPIIMLSARDTNIDMLEGFSKGADDYITKPFDEDILIARIEAMLRRTKKLGEIEFKGLIWDAKVHAVNYKSETISLTPKEFEMLGLFLTHINIVFTREKLIEMIWGYDTETEGRTVDSHIRNMREKIRKSGFPIEEHLKTVWGVGYRWSRNS
jgi:DNA-binding response OmpR family regulator